MYITIKTKIWLTVFAIVLPFSFFSLYYFPTEQEKTMKRDFNNEAQNLANTIALGTKVALTEENFEGVQTSMQFLKSDPRIKFVSLVVIDTIWRNRHSNFDLKYSVIKTEGISHDPNIVSNDSIIVKRSHFNTHMLSGYIMIGIGTSEIIKSQKKIRRISLLISGGIFGIGLLIGLWLARNISVPVHALRDASQLVGKGDLTPVMKKFPRDEIGDLSMAFNKMVKDIKELSELTQVQEKEKQQILASQNEVLEKQVASRTEKLKQSLENLRSTQKQLIQSEKMASLGELTAGIAHEIQNPLNFVNNFSEVSNELVEEMKDQLSKGNSEDAIAIADDVKQNLEKILHHGKRADGIVKGMLQHSRRSSGVKEPTDINTLADEYLRLAYHGLRAKDKSFNANLNTDFDRSIGKINIIPQDIGRVILNLINNAFYAIDEKRKQTQDNYEPAVTISTKKTNGKIEIKVTDNGNGIPQKILDKIFQPFFTTKPTGQGTGLGLSLSYDIIKAHAGEIKTETKESEGSKFIIQLPE